MGGRVSAAMIDAMKMVKAGVTPYAAAKRTGLVPGSIYRSRLYKLFKDGKITALNTELETIVPRARYKQAKKDVS